jgi:hypothetical protein
MENPAKKSLWRVLAAVCIFAAGFCLVASICVVGLSDTSTANRDFIEYWAVGQQLIHGANPYDAAAIMRIERAVGFDGIQPRITFSPPVAFFLVLPLGLVSAKTGLILWLLAIMVSLVASIRMLWTLHGRPNNRLHLLGYLFPPVLVCLLAGQLGIFLLLGIVLFLYFRKSRPFLAGAVLLPCVLKPHLFLPFAIVLLLWAVSRKAYRLLGGFSVTLLASCAFTLYFDIHVWSQYAQMMSESRALQLSPALSVAFRILLDRNAVWLQFLPEAAGCTWALWYFWTRRSCWHWMDQGMLLLIVSAACAPYAFFPDEAMLLPAVLAGLYRAEDSNRSLLPFVLFTGAALIEVFTFVPIVSMFYVWTVPAWLAWYLYATGSKSAAAKEIRSGVALNAD